MLYISEKLVAAALVQEHKNL